MAHTKRKSLETRLREYREGLLKTALDMDNVADLLDETNGGIITPGSDNVRDGAGLLRVITEDLDKLLAGQDLEVMGELPL